MKEASHGEEKSAGKREVEEGGRGREGEGEGRAYRQDNSPCS